MTKTLLFVRIAAISAGITMGVLVLCGFAYWWLNRPKDWNEKAVSARFHDVEVDDSSEPGSLTFRYVLINQTAEDYLLPSPQTGKLMKVNLKDHALDTLAEAVWPSDTIIPAKQSVIIAFKVPCGDVFDRAQDPTIVSCYLNDPYAAYGGETIRPAHASGPDPSTPSSSKSEWDQYTVLPRSPSSKATSANPAPKSSAKDEWDQYAVPANPTHSIPPLPKGYSLDPQEQDEQQTKENVVNATIGGLVFFDYLHRYEIIFPNDWKQSRLER